MDLSVKKYHPFVKKVWILENPSSMFKRNTGMLVGDGRFELAFVSGNGYRTFRNNRTETFHRGIYLGGQMNRPLDLEILPETHITFIKLEPWALGTLSEFNFKESLNETVPLEEINRDLYNKLKIYNPVNQIDKIVQVLSSMLEESSKKTESWKLIKHACSLFDAGYTDFRSAKEKLIFDLELSSRSIETKFAKNVGLAPQQYAIGIRFRKFTEDLEHAKNNFSFTDLAYKHGYFDQSHLNKDFRQYWGFSPKKFAESKTFVTNAEEPFRYYTI